MHITKISPSRIKVFKGRTACSFKYFLNYDMLICDNCDKATCFSKLIEQGIDLKNKKCPFCDSSNLYKPEFEPSFAAEFGSTIHKVLEIYAAERKKGKKRDWKKLLIRGLTRGWKDTPAPNFSAAKESEFLNIEPKCETCEFAIQGKCKLSGDKLNSLSGCPLFLYNKAYKMVEDAIERYDQYFENNLICTEKKFDIFLDDKVAIFGYIDVVLKHDDHIEVVDYKTGNYTLDYDAQKDDIQSRLYSVAAKKLFGCENILLTFDYFTKEPVTVSYSKKEDQQTIKEIIEDYHKIKNSETLTRRNNDWVCRYMCDRPLCDKMWEKWKSASI